MLPVTDASAQLEDLKAEVKKTKVGGKLAVATVNYAENMIDGDTILSMSRVLGSETASDGFAFLISVSLAKNDPDFLAMIIQMIANVAYFNGRKSVQGTGAKTASSLA